MFPYQVYGENRPGRWIVSCDHASNDIPDCINQGCLGISPADMNRHIAYDIGAAGVARALGESLNSPVVLSNFSRLVIDPNRGEDDPTLVMKLYDGTVIPANRHVDAAEVTRRLDRFHRPYHQAYAALAAARDNAVIVAIHSFTPCLRGREPRPWDIGVLHSHVHNSFALRFIERLRRETDLCVGDNEPYSGHLPGDAIDRHALIPRRDNLLIELRNDLIAQPQQQIDWANRLGCLLVDMI
jgi:predicted N-formylglutamate amidohydrolase